MLYYSYGYKNNCLLFMTVTMTILFDFMSVPITKKLINKCVFIHIYTYEYK